MDIPNWKARLYGSFPIIVDAKEQSHERDFLYSLRWKHSAASMTALHFSSANNLFEHHPSRGHTFRFGT